MRPNNETKLTSEQLRAAILHMRDGEGWSQNKIAEEAGVNSGALSQWMRGNPPAKREQFEDTLRGFLNHQKAKREMQDFAVSVHVDDLANTEIVMTTLQHAHATADFVVVYGGAGGGKTHGVRRYQQNASNVYIVTGEPATNNIAAVLRDTCAALKLPVGTCADMSRAIVQHLTGRGALLVFDEAHHYSQRVFDQLRTIYDKVNEVNADFGLALLGNEPLLDKLTTGDAMKQIYSRIGINLRLPSPAVADGRKLVEAVIGKAITERQAIEAHRMVCRIGGYRAIIKTARRAVLQSGRPIRKLTPADFFAAAQQA